MYRKTPFSSLVPKTKELIVETYIFWRNEGFGIATAFKMVRRRWKTITNVTVWKCINESGYSLHSRTLKKPKKRKAS